MKDLTKVTQLVTVTARGENLSLPDLIQTSLHLSRK